MTADDRAIACTAAHFCGAAQAFAIASLALTLLALLVLGLATPHSAWAWWIVALPGAVAPWYAFRIAFDARLFAAFARADDAHVAREAADFDAALARILGRDRVVPRALDERARGARRLVARLVVVTALQFAAALFAALPV